MNKHHVTPVSFYTLKFYAAGEDEIEELVDWALDGKDPGEYFVKEA